MATLDDRASAAACVVAPSRKVEKLLRDYGVRCRIEVIPTGVDLGAYRQEPDGERMAELRRRWALKIGRASCRERV